jgi:uncharacterized protein (TIGR03067 family)
MTARGCGASHRLKVADPAASMNGIKGATAPLPPEAPSTPSAADLAMLQGTWQQVSMEEDGVFNPPDTLGAAGAKTTITGNGFSVTMADGHVLLAGTFELDARTEPKSITWIDTTGPDAGKRLPASYILDGGRFVFIAADEGAPRPTEFRTRPGLTMRSFVRSR